MIKRDKARNRSQDREGTDWVTCEAEGCRSTVPVVRGRRGNPHIKQEPVYCSRHRQENEMRKICAECGNAFTPNQAQLDEVRGHLDALGIVREPHQYVTECLDCAPVDEPYIVVWGPYSGMNESADYAAAIIEEAASLPEATDTCCVCYDDEDPVYGGFLVSLRYEPGQRPTDDEIRERIAEWLDDDGAA